MSTLPTPLLRPELLRILICPTCRGAELRYQEPEGDRAPVLSCVRCGHTYGFANGIPLLYRDDFNWAPKQREAEGWVAMWKDMGLYDQDFPVSIETPFDGTVEPWPTIARMFRGALFQMGLRGGERILDLGAGEGWASQHFAARGAEPVAVDVVPDARLGLGRAWKRMALIERRFDLLIADNEDLPFADCSFDVVFASNALHHHDHLDRLFSAAYRVLKPGGRLIAIGDPVSTIFQQETDWTDGDREKSFGIIERRRRFVDYLFAAWRAGFRNLHAEDDKTFWQPTHELWPWMDRQRLGIEQKPLLGSLRLTKALTWTMMRLPRPFALAMLLTLRDDGLLMISGQRMK